MEKSGIYKIVNIRDKKIYVGSSINLKSRKYDHFKNLRNNKHRNIHLQRAYNRDGEENFKFEIIEEVKFNSDKQILKNNLLEREQYWIDELNVCNDKIGYNLTPIAGSNLGLKWNQESRKKLSESKKGIPAPNKGIPCSEEQKIKISNANKGKKHTEEEIKRQIESRKGYRHSEETKRKISNIHKGRVFSEEHKRKLSEINKGKKLSEETKKKMSESRKGRIFSEETRNKLSEAAKNRYCKNK